MSGREHIKTTRKLVWVGEQRLLQLWRSDMMGTSRRGRVGRLCEDPTRVCEVSEVSVVRMTTTVHSVPEVGTLLARVVEVCAFPRWHVMRGGSLSVRKGTLSQPPSACRARKG